MIDLLKGLSGEEIEALAELWLDKNFKVLVEVLRERQRTLAMYLLGARSWEETQDVRWEATNYSKVINIVSQANKKLNK
jgi:hypothetical protein